MVLAGEHMTTLLSAGYYHIRPADIKISDNQETALPYQPDTAYLVHLKPGKRFGVPTGFAGDYANFEDPSNKLQRYVLLRPRNGDAVSITGTDIANVKKLGFAPTPTEKYTLEYGLDQYGKKANNVAILVDDLGLPSTLSPYLRILIPESYQTLLSGAGKTEPLMVSERKSRNTGTKIVEQRIQKMVVHDTTPETEYQKTGFILGHKTPNEKDARTCANGNLVLCSTSIIDESPSGKQGFAVALVRETNGHTTPSCGVIEAGQLDLLLEKKPSADHIIAVYHAKDDPNIRFKNGDAAFIYAWAKPNVSVDYTQVTLSGDLSATRCEEDCYSTTWLRNSNGTSFAELLGDLKKKHCEITPVTHGKGIRISNAADGHDSACRIA